MTEIKRFYRLVTKSSSLVVDCRGNGPAILYWGSRLGDESTADMLAMLGTRQELQARVATEAPVSLSPQLGEGFPGSAGIHVHRDGRQWGTHARIESVSTDEANTLTIASACSATDIRIVHRLRLEPVSSVLVVSTEIENTGSEPLSVESVSAATIPVPAHYSKILGFEGRWSNEFRTHSVDRFAGCYLRENRSGRTSHDALPAVILH